MRNGEVLIDVRFWGTRLAESTVGPVARIVPLHLANSALIDLVRVGEVVDVLAAPDNATPAVSKIVGNDAVVVLVVAKQ